ncbi:MAG: acyl-CoA desaturase [Gallionellales bacterium 35-53-114]|jgi:stearoyl-CoA desaturase (delta-9 desaturase)|nr:MAG: acyl-CoA desaturase [Gallionellales bacterium 35-53-114]OYZ63684.1 MAG: acyl-CoA desaturase [Gallionellales bacterium 24-53-125]OZB09483.1 MAG: acyl-CoA desaturase [Gallionellales bacterium 39-52-133]HQS57851.1 fatty acid desaturase [Gallionellaceae bacterium]HQS76012.1 fatty acid desaturase [Gallionellaceae bacterium]
MLEGFIDLPWWGYVLATLALTHITIASVTIFLHRHQAHRALDLHPAASHFFRFWLWLSTGIVTKEWAAIHRKHHAKCETVEDPHSPVILGIKKVLTQGYELYREEAKNRETLDKYGHGTPDDWLERNIYSKHSKLGIATMLVVDLLLFGPIGLTIWAIQMAWIPVNAAGIINGAGHYWGYRNYACADASTNLLPWGIFIGGEELHNNHHAYASSAKLSSKWYEIDIGWLYIRILASFKLAQVKKIAPQVRLDFSKTACDLDTLQSVITNRYEVMTKYAASVKKTYKAEIIRLKLQASDKLDVTRIKHWLHLDENELTEQQKAKVGVVILASPTLHTAYTLRQELAAIWARSTASKEQLVKQLEDWCHRAENSGIAALQEFSQRLRCYA